ncbi:MAG: hypothetical protein ABIK93_01955 [candidate division WOR-3 bacterium]
MRIIIALIISLILAVAIFFIAQSNLKSPKSAPIQAKSELLKFGIEFINALAQKDGGRIYRMFNSTFQKEIPLSQLQSAIDRWYEGKSFRGVKFGRVNIFGLSGHITSWVLLKGSKVPKFIYQYWIKTKQGWRLMWLTGILNHRDFVYGVSDTLAQQEIVGLMVEKAVSNLGFEDIFSGVDFTYNIAILHRPGQSDVKINLPHNRVLWLTEEELHSKYNQLKINTYLEFGMVRVMDNIALGALDIIPIPQARPRPEIKRRRSISMFFQKENGRWQFAGYGSKW